MNLKQVLEKTTQFFKEKNIPSPRLDAEILLSYSLGFKNRVEIYLKFDRPMSESDLTTCREVVRRRAQGEPVAYILGQRDFYKHTFKVGPGVLIPRPETEQIVENSLAWMHSQQSQEQNDLASPELAKLESHPPASTFQVLDIGAGSGCIGLSILAINPNATLYAIEKSSAALEYARVNCQDLGLSDRVDFVLGDALSSLKSETFAHMQFDVVVANPPYISHTDPLVEENVKKFEPSEALFAENEGLQLVEQWVEGLKGHLNKPSMVMFEIGKDQGLAASAIFKQTGLFDEVTVQKDLAGLDRFVIGLIK